MSQLLNTAIHTHSGTGPRTGAEDSCPYLAQHKKLHFHMRRIDEQSVDEVWDCQLLVSFFCLLVLYFSIDPTIMPAHCSAKYQCGQARWGGGQWRVVESQLEALLNGRTAPRDCWLPSVLMFPCTPTSASLSMRTNFKTAEFLSIIWLFLRMRAFLPISVWNKFECKTILSIVRTCTFLPIFPDLEIQSKLNRLSSELFRKCSKF